MKNLVVSAFILSAFLSQAQTHRFIYDVEYKILIIKSVQICAICGRNKIHFPLTIQICTVFLLFKNGDLKIDNHEF